MSPPPMILRFKGERFTLAELAKLSGISRGTIRARLREGWTVEQALVTPTPKQRRAGVLVNFQSS